MKIYSYQNLAILLNNGIRDGLITAEDAIEIMCTAMPLTFHKGNFYNNPRKGCITVKEKRLITWWNEYGDHTPIVETDIVELLQGN